MAASVVRPGPPPWPSHVRFHRLQTWSVRQAAQFCFALGICPRRQPHRED